MTFLVLLLIVGGVALRAMSAEERARLGRTVLAAIREARDVVVERRRRPEPFRDALRARTPWAIVTPALVALNLIIFVRMFFDAGGVDDSGSLVGWGGTVYGASKGAVHALTKAVAVEAAPFGIRVNAICPAAMPFTGFMAAGGVDLPEDALADVAESVGAGHPLGRPITAEDCAEVAAFLASDRAINLTGILVPVDGGYVAR